GEHRGALIDGDDLRTADGGRDRKPADVSPEIEDRPASAEQRGEALTVVALIVIGPGLLRGRGRSDESAAVLTPLELRWDRLLMAGADLEEGLEAVLGGRGLRADHEGRRALRAELLAGSERVPERVQGGEDRL